MTDTSHIQNRFPRLGAIITEMESVEPRQHSAVGAELLFTTDADVSDRLPKVGSLLSEMEEGEAERAGQIDPDAPLPRLGRRITELFTRER